MPFLPPNQQRHSTEGTLRVGGLTDRQITTPALHHSSFFTGRMPFLPPNQQRQSTEGCFDGHTTF